MEIFLQLINQDQEKQNIEIKNFDIGNVEIKSGTLEKLEIVKNSLKFDFKIEEKKEEKPDWI